MTGTLRFNFGTLYLWDGIVLIPFVIGVLAIGEVINLGTKQQASIAYDRTRVISGSKGLLEGMKDVFRYKICFFRSACIGTIVGIIPGIGGAVANVVSYTIAFQSSNHPETFGKGDPEGVLMIEFRGKSAEEVREMYLRQSSMRSFASAEDVANLALFLASDKSARISGQAIGLDGHTESLMNWLD